MRIAGSFVAVAAATIALAGCGGSGDSSPSGATTALQSSPELCKALANFSKEAAVYENLQSGSATTAAVASATADLKDAANAVVTAAENTSPVDGHVAQATVQNVINAINGVPADASPNDAISQVQPALRGVISSFDQAFKTLC